ncbi:beta-galactosidase [Deinococcus cellulosilyticus]|uniref:Beta-galactosidase n=1 Tax=Deinococcus cellulosilyticus (strain DSM 18568 / NBRC 106333 / KACC 11606 / 5516J-15) TaxID=1223518 RepID=A0A511MWB5_DEIC1|nr:beta-galactosidase [Deinococcus cellulosilyticus]GEM44874.1 beta-galactosidase [Deinococcus cellulosilyticus NBRC 106333 = KACC 11606]
MTEQHHPHLTLGVCDYPEHVPRDRWEIYAQQQKELGLTYVRIAEFAWALMEPTEGEYNWTWLDEAVEVLHREGLKVVLCTPTATPPAWLIRKHPEILAWDAQGKVRAFGSRRHYDFASEVYREHSRRITRAMAERYGQHPGVAGWQTDNEFGCHDTTRSYGPASQAAFPMWLQSRYESIDQLNEAWGNVFWSQTYSGFDQIGLPNLTVTEPNPSHVLDYCRFASDMIRTFQEEQVSILRECSPGRFITHNFMIFFSDFDHYEVSKCLDFVSWDAYPTGMLEFFASWESDEVKQKYARTGHPDLISFNHDLYRGLKAYQGGHPLPFWVMEQQCGQVNWAPYNPLPADGAVKLWTAQAWAHGADTVSYFRWRAATMAQEVMHSGLLRHDETPDRGFDEVKALSLSDFPAGDVPAQVALLHDYESLWIWDQQKHNQDLSYWRQVMLYYSTLRSLGVDVDVVHPSSDLSKYALIVAPALTLMTEETMEALRKATEHALLIFGPRTAYRTASGRTPETGQFGTLADLVGGKLRNFDSLRPGLREKVDQYDVTLWAEGYQCEDATPVHVYESGPLAGVCAVMRKGNVLTIGAHSPGLVYDLLREALAEARVSVLDVPEGIRVSRRSGKMLVQNFNAYGVDVLGTRMPAVSVEMLP